MRSGACTVQQTLTAEAASVLKHSLSLARRRGHAQVTPLHVAATLLSSRTSLLRRACLKSQPQQQPAAPSHPLQCRALELCFNVALNRLPTAPAPLFHGQPSLSNALIAALKRAQAHQRRGCIEQQQQQPLLTIKVELEQLVISILDDPSVSRVMREAGFSSTAVKTNIEDSSASSVFQCYSASGAGGVFSSPCSPSHPHAETQREVINPNPFWQTHFLAYATSSDQNPSLLFSPPKVVSSHYFSDSYSASLKEDIKVVFEVFLRKKKRNTVIIADCFSTAEGLVGELMKRLERGDAPAELKQTHFIKFHFAPVTLRFMKKEDVEMNISELKRKLDSVGDGGGVIIYTGDLKWTVDQEALHNGEVSAAHYSPVDHLVLEMGRLLADYRSSNAKVWLMAIASYQTYMRCQMRQPSLEVQWSLQAVSVPSGGLGLSLHGSSIPDHSRAACLSLDHPSQVFISNGKDEQDKFNCCPECTSNYEKEAQVFIKSSGQHKQLPPWLQLQAANDNRKDELEELKRKWSRLCQSLHHEERSAHGHFGSSNLCNNLQTRAGKSYSYAFSYPWWKSHNSIFPDSSSISFSDSAMKPNSSPPAGSVAKFRRQQSCTIDFNFRNGNQKQQPAGEPSLDTLKNSAGKEVKVTLALGHSSFSESGKLEEGRTDHLCELLQENVPWQSEIMPSLAEALIGSKCAKGTDTWILIEGNDRAGKRRLGLAVAETVSGSADLLLHMNMRRRTENEVTASNSAVLERAFRNQERLVVFVEDVDFADSQFMKFLSDRFESGKFGESMMTEGRNIGQAIFILTKVGESTTYDDDSKMNHDDSVIQMMLKVSETKPSSLGTTTDHKRKADEREISGRNKTPRVNGKESASSISVEDGTNKKDLFSRQSSNTLDLNLKADEEDEEEDKPGEFSPISSDLTRDTTSDPVSPRSCFLDSIKNRFVFDHNEGQKRQMIEFFLSKLTRCFEEVVGDQSVIGFSTEEKVLEELLDGSGSFLNSMFEKWLKEIFQTKLRTVKNIGGGEGIGLRLCFRDKSNKVLEDGFKGTCLPKNFLVSFF